ncbi:hypothetical protein [Lactiplantibacillus pentosus]|uniref:hypothetical protein n=1 Tax=Lactiplantibacillus pentosus TaxID=1589 RepID=UPI00132FCC95|nr:hypothetical protein [Lactiplantibacillus pentosus]MBQ0837139.1 hypothetical protein [Lactiplantibacillus pentosus]MBU7464937.1 hypothetical protein [Lactiplantibacillus pentosus]MBU7490845.1 hypothetical protein [Lactiplantibacillus pentosus]MBU7495190.1 hypothetical protein [Lactiplantibacillus pentosus]MBU7521167.1 hypothetical protein [Lactiplantibacillus pentosus]
MSGRKEKLQNLIRAKKVKVCVVGLGYVGLPMLCAIHDAGFYEVEGFDLDEQKVESLNHGESYIDDISDIKLDSLWESTNLS